MFQKFQADSLDGENKNIIMLTIQEFFILSKKVDESKKVECIFFCFQVYKTKNFF